MPRDIDGPYGFGMKESLQDRLKSALKESPLNQTSLAKLVGITQPTISDLVNLEGTGSSHIASAAPRLQKGDTIPYSDQEVQVMLSKKKKTSHLLHLVLSLLTVGVWILIWFIVALSNHMENAGIDRKIAAGKKIR